MAISFVELFDMIDKAGKPNMKTQKDRKDLLIKYQTQHLKDFLKYTFDPNIVFDLPKGRPPFQPQASGGNSKLIYGQIRMIHYFTNVYKGNLNPFKKETMFITMLESVSPEEAELLIQMKDKKLKVAGLTRSLVKEAFPDILP